MRRLLATVTLAAAAVTPALVGTSAIASPLASHHTQVGDDRHGRHPEPGDDRGKHREPGDDRGRHHERGDDRGRHHEPRDDRRAV